MKKKLNNFNLLIVSSYLILILGFFFRENITTGGINIDWVYHKKLITGFADDFQNYFSTYNNRHSPIFYIIFSYFKKIGLDFESIRFIHFHINLVTLFFTYKCIQIKYPNIKKINILFLGLILILLSPNLRTSGYWPSPYPLSMTFLVVSFYYCLRFIYEKSTENEKIKFILLNIFFLALSSYISPNLCLFSIYFAYVFLKTNSNKNIILIIILTNLLLALPAIYYTFIYNKFFMFNLTVSEDVQDSVRFNFINKIFIISSIIFFHLIPFILKFDNKKLILNFKSQIKFILPLILFFLLAVNNFNFRPEFGGGGFFYQLSNNLTKSNYLFFVIAFISLVFLLLVANKKINNFLLIIIFLMMNPQLSIYHRYYDPLLLLIFLLFFNHDFFKKKLIENNLIIILLIYTVLFNLLYSLKNLI